MSVYRTISILLNNNCDFKFKHFTMNIIIITIVYIFRELQLHMYYKHLLLGVKCRLAHSGSTNLIQKNRLSVTIEIKIQTKCDNIKERGHLSVFKLYYLTF